MIVETFQPMAISRLPAERYSPAIRRTMRRPSDGILSTIGDTPLVRLSRAIHGVPWRLYAKLELFNPGGSIKDRVALNLLRQALDDGDLRAGGTVIESSSGNMGIGLAQACTYLGLRFVCVVDPKTTSQNIAILRAYGAEVDLVAEPDPVSGEYLPARIERVRELRRTIPNSFWPNQYANPFNAAAHKRTMAEIVAQLDGKVDYLFCATSTCGTLRGCAEYVHAHGLHTTVVAVDAVGSVIFGDKPAKRLIPGHGAARTPELFRPGLADRSVLVSDLECVVACRSLLRREAILAGGSSGAVLAAIERLKGELEPGAVCVAILADRGERYLDTIYDDAWVKQHFGDWTATAAEPWLVHRR